VGASGSSRSCEDSPTSAMSRRRLNRLRRWASINSASSARSGLLAKARRIWAWACCQAVWVGWSVMGARTAWARSSAACMPRVSSASATDALVTPLAAASMRSRCDWARHIRSPMAEVAREPSSSWRVLLRWSITSSMPIKDSTRVVAKASRLSDMNLVDSRQRRIRCMPGCNSAENSERLAMVRRSSQGVTGAAAALISQSGMSSSVTTC